MLLAARDLEFVNVRTALALADYLDEALALELLDVLVGRLPSDADIIGKPLLAGEAIVVVPSVGDQSRVSHLCAHGDLLRTKHGVGHLSEALLGEVVRAF